MKKEELFTPIKEKYDELKRALTGTDIEEIRKLTLEVHAMVHPAEISGSSEKTIADYVLEYMFLGNQNQIFNSEWQRKIGASITDTGNALEFDEAVAFGKGINILALRDYMITVGKNTRCILENLTLEQIQSMVPEEWVMRILEEGGVTTDFRSVWLLVFWGRLTRGGMILTPMTDHHMMHLPPCLNNLPILDE